MKLRSTTLAFAFLILMGSLASAATTDQTATPVLPMAGEAALATPAQGSPDCAAPALPFLASEQKGGGAACGACSESVCAGYTTGTICGYRNGQLARCEAAYGGLCSTGVGLNCYCWIGDIP